VRKIANMVSIRMIVMALLLVPCGVPVSTTCKGT
jgi:hypothetical protein